jgi:hypothetical protein
MSKKMLGIILIVVGVVVALAVVVGGLIGFPSVGFGLKKIAVIILGVVIVAVGIGISMAKESTPASK